MNELSSSHESEQHFRESEIDDSKFQSLPRVTQATHDRFIKMANELQNVPEAERKFVQRGLDLIEAENPVLHAALMRWDQRSLVEPPIPMADITTVLVELYLELRLQSVEDGKKAFKQ